LTSPLLGGVATPSEIGALRSEVLENGLTVSVLPDPSGALVATQVWYHVGSANEEAGSRGLAHLFEHLMFGSTDAYDEEAYARHHHRHGGYENAYTTPDETVYVSTIAPPHHRRVLEMEAQRMRGLQLTRRQLDNEKKIVAEELRLTTENDPLSRAYVTALRALLGEHPYAVAPVGTPEDLAAITLEDCREFYDRHYGPANAHLVISGPVDVERTLVDVRRLFAGMPSEGGPAPEVPTLLSWEFPRETVVEEDLPPVEVAVVGFPLPEADNPENLAILLMLQIVAGSEVDPLREELVVRHGKALEAGTEVLRLRRAGALLFYSVHLPYRRQKTAFRQMEQAREGLARMDWLTEDSLAAAKRRLIRSEMEHVYRAESRAASLGRAEWWQGDDSRALDLVPRIEQVGRDEVAEVFRRYVAEPEPVRLYLEPERVPLWIRLFGWLYPLVS
jgi:zinc protease